MLERYMYRVPDRNGEFRRVGTAWQEFQNLVLTFNFVEESRTAATITLHDASRGIRVLLPVAGGTAFFRRDGDPSLNPLFNVDRIERTFTAAQRATLANDSAQARTMLDRVLTRMTEAVIVPTPSLLAMRQAVTNIFHIDLMNQFPGPVEAFQFTSLVANFRTLRTTGFNADPTFVFEPDDTRTNVAFVNGVDDPTVHIAPHHFYMDREGVIVTLIHERAHTVLRLNGHPGGIHVLPDPALGVAGMTHDEAMHNAFCYEWLTLAMIH